MNLNKISSFIKSKRKELGITQEELASRLYVTEKAISRWETGRGTPDISLLLPLSKELKVEVSELLNGENDKKEIEKIIEYNELTKSNKHNTYYKIIILLYTLSILSFLYYLRLEYNPNIELNYFIRLFITIISSILMIIGNIIYSNNYVERIEDKKKVLRISHIILFVYYIILLFNMALFARYHNINSYNFVPFKSIIAIINGGSLYNITINILGNILIFIPLEYFLIELFKINKLAINTIISILIVIFIEILQYTFKVGVFDVDDIILCNLGMFLFYIIYNKIKPRFL